MRKFLVILFLLSSIGCSAQNYLLLDRGYERSAFISDTITKTMKEGYFPIYQNEFDSLLILLEPLWDIVKLGLKRTYLNSDDFATSHLTFKITNVQGAYGDKYDIDITSITQAGKISMRLSNSQQDDYINKNLMYNFIRYLRKTKKEIATNKIKAY